MGGNQSKSNDTTRRSFNNDNPIIISQVAEHRASASDAKAEEIVQESQSDLQPPFRDVTSGYNINKEGEAWRRKIDELKRNHDAINKAMEREYDKAVQESYKMFKKTEVVDPPCVDLETLVMKCYRDNPNQTLMCAKFVSDYKKCVTNKRPCVKVSNP